MSAGAVSPSSTRRRLWLAIARHVVQQQVRVSAYVCVLLGMYSSMVFQ